MFAVHRLLQQDFFPYVVPDIEFVQAAIQTSWGVSGDAVTFTDDITAGNGVVGMLGDNGEEGDVITSATGGGFGALTNQASLADGQMYYFSGIDSAGGSDAIVVEDTTNQWAGVMAEFSGISRIPQQIVSVGGPSFTDASVTINPAVAGQMMILMIMVSSAQTITPPGGWSTAWNDGLLGYFYRKAVDADIAAGEVTADFTLTFTYVTLCGTIWE